jgi:hypothetical protein
MPGLQPTLAFHCHNDWFTGNDQRQLDYVSLEDLWPFPTFYSEGVRSRMAGQKAGTVTAAATACRQE